MSITIAPSAITERETTASAVEAYRAAAAKLSTLHPTSRNTFVVRARETQAIIMQGMLDAVGGSSSTLGADLVRERKLQVEIARDTAAGRLVTERLRSLGRVQGRIHRRVTSRSN